MFSHTNILIEASMNFFSNINNTHLIQIFQPTFDSFTLKVSLSSRPVTLESRGYSENHKPNSRVSFANVNVKSPGYWYKKFDSSQNTSIKSKSLSRVQTSTSS